MNKEIIKRFRNEVNKQDLVLQIYRNRNGKNFWNIICSAMDWIDVVVETIDIKNLSNKNDNNSSIKVMTFITCIDVLWEAVQQLHRVFFDTDTMPYDDKTEVFQHRLFVATDNDYFKTIRACFATHPINLNDYFTCDKKKERRYASWSGGGFSKGDFSVILYSNQPNKDALFFDIYFDELMKFAEQRYCYLDTIAEEIERQRKEYIAFWKSKKIEQVVSVNQQIVILIEEAKQRFNNDYYNYELENLKIIFSTPIIDPQNLKIVTQYRLALRSEIDELFTVLQEMQLVELKSSQDIDDACPVKCQSAFSKLVDVVFNGGHIQLVSMDMFKACSSDLINFENIESIMEFYVIMKAGFFMLNRGDDNYE